LFSRDEKSYSRKDYYQKKSLEAVAPKDFHKRFSFGE